MKNPNVNYFRLVNARVVERNAGIFGSVIPKTTQCTSSAFREAFSLNLPYILMEQLPGEEEPERWR